MGVTVDGVPRGGQAITFDAAAGYIWLGDCLLQWGSAISTDDTAQDFPFPIPFPNACFVAFHQRTASGTKNILALSAVSTTNLTINRDDAIDGSQPFDWFAVGY